MTEHHHWWLEQEVFLHMLIGNRKHIGAVPEIILKGAAFFFSPSTPRTHMESEPPPTPRTRKCFNYPRPTMDQIRLDPQDKLPPHSPPLGHVVNKTFSPHRTKKCLRPNPPRIISGTALDYIQ